MTLVNEARRALAEAIAPINPGAAAKELGRQQEADRAVAIDKYFASREERIADDQAKYADWLQKAEQKRDQIADPDGTLRAAVEQTGTAWREALDKQIKLTADLETVERERPTAEKAIVAWIKRKHEIMNDLDSLAADIPQLEAAYHTAEQALNRAQLAVNRQQELATAKAARDLAEEQKRALQAANLEASRWAGLRRKIEGGQI